MGRSIAVLKRSFYMTASISLREECMAANLEFCSATSDGTTGHFGITLCIGLKPVLGPRIIEVKRFI